MIPKTDILFTWRRAIHSLEWWVTFQCLLSLSSFPCCHSVTPPPPPPPLFLFHLLGWEASPIAGLTLWAPRSWLYVIAAKEGEEGLSASKVNKITLPREITYHSMTKKGRPSIIKMIYPSGFSPSHTPVLQEVWLRTIPDSRLAEKMYSPLQYPMMTFDYSAVVNPTLIPVH